jgi:hypothetical protein
LKILLEMKTRMLSEGEEELKECKRRSKVIPITTG